MSTLVRNLQRRAAAARQQQAMLAPMPEALNEPVFMTTREAVAQVERMFGMSLDRKSAARRLRSLGVQPLARGIWSRRQVMALWKS